MTDIGIIYPDATQPVRPIGSAVEVNERKLQDVSHPADTATSRQELRTAHGKEPLRGEPDGVQARPIAVAVTHGKIDLLAGKIDVMHVRGDAQIDIGMRLGKLTEPVHQPFRGKVRRGADRENAGTLSLKQSFGP